MITACYCQNNIYLSTERSIICTIKLIKENELWDKVERGLYSYQASLRKSEITSQVTPQSKL
jgi:hypothetical protein